MPRNKTPSISTFLFSDDPEASQKFLVEAFGLAEGELSRDDKGKALVGRAYLGDYAVSVARPHPGRMEAASHANVLHSLVMVYLDDVDSVYEKAKAADAKIEYEPTDMPYGQREFGARDADGNLWCFAKELTA
ncbi:VOC family protein [Amycolatopsis sp. NPDC004079]|uniref:VOC family protein n=1 Tax=Amycolatopsis sp. NPDC004079 TaxID=3154549 RepID=UPI0033B1BEA7